MTFQKSGKALYRIKMCILIWQHAWTERVETRKIVVKYTFFSTILLNANYHQQSRMKEIHERSRKIKIRI